MTKIIGRYPVKCLSELGVGDIFIPSDGVDVSDVYVRGNKDLKGLINCIRIFSEEGYHHNYACLFTGGKKVSVVRIDGNFVVEGVR